MNVATPSPRLPAVNVLAICAGVGGLELGLQLAHHHRGQAVRGVCYVEREAGAAASLVASMDAGWLHPAPVWSDARTFDGAAWRGCVDIVTSGDPCQGNSVAGKRRGELDDRWLLDRAIDIFDASGAHTFFRENVPGNADGQLAVAIPALERLGCRIAVGIFSSAETGNTMRRERLFILARRERDRQARRIAGPGEAQSGWPCGQSGGRSGALARSSSGSSDDVDRAACLRKRGIGRKLSGSTHANGSCRPHGREWNAVNSSAELVISEGVGPGESRPEHAGQQGRYPVAGAGDELGRTGGAEPQGQQRGQQRGQHHPAGRQVKGGHPELSGRTILPPAVIPGPSDNRGWIDVLDRFPELQPALSEEEAQSHLRRGIDAMAHRVERLRATGNGVDPMVAAYAYLSLDARLAADRGREAVGASVMVEAA